MSDELICPGNPEATIAFRAWHDEIFKPEPIKGVGKVRARQEGVRTTIQLDDPEKRFVSLSGFASPYAGIEVYPSPSGIWNALPSIAAIPNIYEDNGITGLGGNVVKIRQTIGEWRFRYARGGGSGVHPHVVHPCNNASWPNLFLTVMGVTVTLVNDTGGFYGAGSWVGVGTFPIAGVNPSDGLGTCSSRSDITILFILVCTGSPTKFPHLVYQWNNGAADCYVTGCASYANKVYGSGAGNQDNATFTDFTNSPVSGSGNFVPGTSSQFCGAGLVSMSAPLGSNSFALSQ